MNEFDNLNVGQNNSSDVNGQIGNIPTENKMDGFSIPNSNNGTSEFNTANQRYSNMNSNYQYENRGAYSNVASSNFNPNGRMPYTQQIPPQPKKPKVKSGFFKRLVASVALGIFFGGFAGISFFAVKEVSSYVNHKSAISSGVETVKSTDSGTLANAGDKVEKAVSATDTGDNASTLQTTNTVTAVVTDVTDVVEKVMPSVVSITNYYTQQENYFGQELESKGEAGGSGIIIGQNDTELLIVTNYHVVEGANSLSVQFIDESKADAQVKGTNPQMDLAVIAIPLDSLTADTKANIAVAQLGDSDNLKVGEPAIAIGNALGYGQSVTTGVISALNRSIADEMSTEDSTTGSESVSSLIQTDAAINPGNSGGALLNVEGEVVGINSNKIGGTVVEGMGYAIPISSAKPIIEKLMLEETKTKVSDAEKAWLGIAGVDVTAEVAATYGMPEGVYISNVYDGTAAQQAGIVKGDIITSFDGTEVSSMEALKTMLEYYSAGTSVEIKIQQGSPSGYQEKVINITLGSKPADVSEQK